MLCTAALIAVLAVAAYGTDDVVRVSGGSIVGVRDSSANLRYWKGVPFGADTGGANRFQPPQPRVPWSPAVLNCTNFAAGCYSNHHNADTAPVQSEDCLNLNIYAPLAASLQVNICDASFYFHHFSSLSPAQI